MMGSRGKISLPDATFHCSFCHTHYARAARQLYCPPVVRMTMKHFSIAAAVVVMAAVLISACSSDSDDTPVTPNTTADRSGAMVLIKSKGASFQMGSTAGSSDEQPVHAVAFTYDFYMDTTEVTQETYDRVMLAGYAGYGTPFWGAPFGEGPNYPAYSVEWEDAALYCNALSRQEGLDTVYAYTAILGTPGNGCKFNGLTMHPERNGYRLPTEAEWEFACRAGSTTDFYWQKNYQPYPETAADSSEISAAAVWAANSWYLSSDHADFGTRPVAQHTPNAWGLYDMAGNLTEWCHDWYGDNYYAESSASDPTGPDSGDWHALRGGNWGNEAVYLRSSNRTFSSPDYLFYFIGFRTVRPVR